MAEGPWGFRAGAIFTTHRLLVGAGFVLAVALPTAGQGMEGWFLGHEDPGRHAGQSLVPTVPTWLQT